MYEYRVYKEYIIKKDNDKIQVYKFDNKIYEDFGDKINNDPFYLEELGLIKLVELKKGEYDIQITTSPVS